MQSANYRQRVSINRFIATNIERRNSEAIHYDPTQLVLPPDRPVIDVPPEIDSNQLPISFDMIERIDRNLRGEANDLDRDLLAMVRDGLVRVSKIPSGKRGHDGFRHAMDRSSDGNPVPKRLPTGSPTICADALCVWLSELQNNNPDHLGWLARKYIYCSEAEKGRFRLNNDNEIAYLERIPTSKYIRIDIEGAPVAKSRRRTQAKQTQRGRIRCLDSDQGPIRRDHTAIVWVMLYLFAVLGIK